MDENSVDEESVSDSEEVPSDGIYCTKIGVLGPLGVGKSALVQFIVQKVFTDVYHPTTYEDTYRFHLPIDDKVSCMMQLTDTSISSYGTPFWALNYSINEAFLLCYSLMDPSEEVALLLENIYEEMRAKNYREPCVVVVGTKLDLFSGDPESTPVAKFARRRGLHHVLCSAKNDVNVSLPFELVFKLRFGFVPHLTPVIFAKRAQ
jgi:GTPase SAR1 family protein